MFRKSLMTTIAAGLLWPSIANAEIIDDLLNINDILGSLCGQRMTVLWVDETEQIGPCLLAYSAGCVEAQMVGPQSCSNPAEAAKPEAEPIQITSAAVD